MTQTLSVPAKLSSFLYQEFEGNLQIVDLAAILDAINKQGVSSELLEVALNSPTRVFLPQAIKIWEICRTSAQHNKPSTLSDWIAEVTLKLLLLRWFDDLGLECLLKPELSKRGASLRKTRFLYFSLGSQAAYEAARKLADIDRDYSRRFFQKTILLGERALQAAFPHELQTQERYLRGFIGVAHLFISFGTIEHKTRADSRDEMESVRPSGGLDERSCYSTKYFADRLKRHAHLKEAVVNLRRSGELGDKSPAHAKYLAETLSELADIDQEQSGILLEEAITILRSILATKDATSDMCLLMARILVQYNSFLLGNFENKSIVLLHEAVGYYDRGLAGENSFQLANARGRRGQALLFLAWETEDTIALDRAVDDLRYAYASGESQWTALFIDSLLTRQAIQPSDSANDALEAWRVARREDGRIVQAGNILNLRERRLRAAYVRGRAASDVAALEEVIFLSNENEKELCGKAKGLLGLIRQDTTLLEEAVSMLVDIVPSVTGSGPGLLPKLTNALARMVAHSDPSRAIELLEIGTRALQQLDKAGDPLNTWLAAKQRFHAWRIGGDPDHLADALALSQAARSMAAPSAENLVLAANIELQAAKLSESMEERQDLLEAAAADLAEAQPFATGLDEKISHSKLGEILLRLGALTGNRHMLQNARSLFELSHAKGNNTPELFGLLGDTIYHLSKGGEIAQRVELLKLALAWKIRARAFAAQSAAKRVSREHFSLCARMHLTLHELGVCDEDHLGQAIRNLSEARQTDPAWPWPICQMAEITTLSADDIDRDPDPIIRKAFSDHDSEILWRRAAEMTMNSSEFAAQSLGGKSGVWYAKDDLGLVSSTFVFKPAPEKVIRKPDGTTRAKRNLEEEMKRVTALGHLLSAEGLQVFVPRMIGVLSMADGRPVLAMRRLAGETLADALVHNRNWNIKHLHTAVNALAAYQALTPFTIGPNEKQQQAERLLRVIRRAGNRFPMELYQNLIEFVPALTSLPLVARRDAHPGNWFVTTHDELVVLDVEHPNCKLYVEELCQLVEDVPVFAWDEDGVQKRREIINKYKAAYAHYSRMSDGLNDSLFWQCYLAFSALLGIFGMTLARNQMARASITPVEKHRWESRHLEYDHLALNAATQFAVAIKQ